MTAGGERRNGGRAGNETGQGGGAKVAYVGGISQGVGTAAGALRNGRGTPEVCGRATTSCAGLTQRHAGGKRGSGGGSEAGNGGTTYKKISLLPITELGEEHKGRESKAGRGACTVGEGEQETESGWGRVGGCGIGGCGAAAVRPREKSANARACRCRKHSSSTEVTLSSGGTSALTPSAKKTDRASGAQAHASHIGGKGDLREPDLKIGA